MLSLDTVNRTLAILLAGAVSTAELVWAATYTLYTTSGLTPGTSHGQSNGVTPVTVMPAPGSGEFRQLKWFSIRNADSVDATVIVRYADSSTNRDLLRITLDPGDVLAYTTGRGWYVLTADGSVKGTGGGGGLPPDGAYADITVSGSGTSWTVGNDKVTYAKMQNVSAASRLLGRGSAAGAGDPQEITLGTNLSLSGTTLNATAASTPPGGSHNDIQVNSSGAFAGTSELQWVWSTSTLKVDNTGSAAPAGWFESGSNICYLAQSTFAISMVGLFCSDQVTTGMTSLGTLIGRFPIYDNSQTLVGYVPVYDNIT